ncbi:MAG: DNA repair and recombination protein RadB [Methermicoccaceae archaeon]
MKTSKIVGNYELKALVSRVSTGCEPLDAMLGGGFERGVVTQLFGEAGSGKTNICLQTMANTTIAGGRVVFIDTEGFSSERLAQIAGEYREEVFSRFTLYEPLDLTQQAAVLRDVEERAEHIDNLSLIVLDSATALYRFSSADVPARREMGKQIASLQRLARQLGIAIIITNQVYTDMDTGEYLPIGGMALAHLCKATIRLSRLEGARRKATILKHRSRPEGEHCEFTITGNGIE